MDELHESGRKVDCLDFLIRNTEKEMKQADICVIRQIEWW
jgi:hypothetical protein